MACTWGDTVSLSPEASIKWARNTRSACGKGPRENATVCQGLLTNLGSRGLRTDRSLLVIRRWREGPRHGRDPDRRARRTGAAVSGP